MTSFILYHSLTESDGIKHQLSSFKQTPLNKQSSLYTQNEVYVSDNIYCLINGKISKYKPDLNPQDLSILYQNGSNLEDFSGQFSFGIFDPDNDYYLLMNDTLGTFPIFYYQSSDKLIVSNEIKNIFLFENIDKSISEQKLIEYFGVNFTDNQETLFQQIKRLAPGHSMEIVEKELIIRECHSFLDKKSWEASKDLQFKSVLEKSVRKYFSANTACELSGGVDSAIVTTFANKLDNSELKTFSILFPNHTCNEEEYINAVTEDLKLDSCKLNYQVLDVNFYKELAKSNFYFPEYPNSVHMFHYLEEAKKLNIQNLLTGFGGDHLFSGFLFEPSQPNILSNLIPYKWKKILKRQYYPWLNIDCEKTYLDLTQKFYQKFNNLNLKKYQLGILFQIYHPNTSEMLCNSQLLANRFAINRYHPLLDNELIKLALHLPYNKFVKKGLNKYILRKNFELASQISKKRNKAEFSSLFVEAIFQEDFKEVFFAGLKRFQNYLNVSYLTKTYEQKHYQSEKNLIFAYWNIIGLELFYETINS